MSTDTAAPTGTLPTLLAGYMLGAGSWGALLLVALIVLGPGTATTVATIVLVAAAIGSPILGIIRLALGDTSYQLPSWPGRRT